MPYVNKTCAPAQYTNLLLKSVSWVASQIALYRGDNCTKIAPKSQLVYTCDFEVATSARQKLH